jgi:hypothetical protein
MVAKLCPVMVPILVFTPYKNVNFVKWYLGILFYLITSFENLIFFKTKKKIHLQQYQILKITDMMKVNSLLKLGGELAKLGCTCI